MNVILTVITGPNGQISSNPITREAASRAVADVFNVPADGFANTDKITLPNGYVLKVTEVA